MPDYTFTIEGDNVVVRPKRLIDEQLPLPNLSSLHLKGDTYDAARRAAPGWDVHYLETEWRSWVVDKGIAVKDADRHFVSFCKKRGPYR